MMTTSMHSAVSHAYTEKLMRDATLARQVRAVLRHKRSEHTRDCRHQRRGR